MTTHASEPRKSAPMRFLRRTVHAFVYHLIVKRAIRRTDVISMLGLSLTIYPSVFHPKFYLTSKFFGNFLQGLDLSGKEFLEIGCGSGILSLIAARRGAQVTAVDINPRAVECTALNAQANGLEKRVRTLESDLFDKLAPDECFDVILWSPPFFPRDPVDIADHAWNAGRGFSVIQRFASNAGSHLRENGRILFLLSSDTEVRSIISLFESLGFQMSLARKSRRLFEVLSIHEFCPEQRVPQ